MSSDTPFYSSILVDQYANNEDGPDILLRKARGTVSSPNANQNNDQIGKFFFYTHDGTDFDAVSAIMASSVVSSTNFGSRLEFFTTTDEDINVNTAIPQFTIKEDGNSEFTGVVSATGFETSGTVTATSVTIETQLTFSSDATSISPLQLNASALIDGVGALSIDSVEPDINLNDTDGNLFTTVTFESMGVPRVAFGKNSGHDFYITGRDPGVNSGNWRDTSFVLDSSTGNISMGYNLSVSGTVSSGGTVLTSDKRLKSNFEISPYGLSDILNLKPIIYDKYTSVNRVNSLGKEIGFIAQEVLTIIPELVKKGEDKNQLLSLNYIGLIPILTKAIQEQQGVIEKNKSEINQLKSELNSLKSLVEKYLDQSTKK